MIFIYAILTYFAWVYIHEYAHLMFLKRFVRVKRSTMRLYPHYHEALGFVFGSVSYDYDETLTDKEWAWVSFAPRIANALVLPLALIFGSTYTPLTIFLIGGIIDLLRGCLTGRESADIHRYSKGFKIPLKSLIACQLIYASCCVLALIGDWHG